MKVKIRLDADAINPDSIRASMDYVISSLESNAEERHVALNWSRLDVWMRSGIRGDCVVTAKAPVLR